MEGFYALTVHNLFWQNSKFHWFPDLKFPYWDMIKKIRQLWLSWERKLSHLANLTWDVEVCNRKQLIFIDVISSNRWLSLLNLRTIKELHLVSLVTSSFCSLSLVVQNSWNCLLLSAFTVLTVFTIVASIISRVSKRRKFPIWSKEGLPFSLITLHRDWTWLWKELCTPLGSSTPSWRVGKRVKNYSVCMRI